ncbi:MAG: O-antigen ligase family protein [Gemmatimonadales bacterium]
MTSAVPDPSLSAAVRWQAALAVGVIALIYTNAPRVAWDAGLSPFPPYVALGLLSAGAVPLIFRSAVTTAVLRSPLLLWGMGYFALIGLGFFGSSQSDVAVGAVLTACLTVLTLLLFLLIFADQAAVQAARRALVVATVFAVLVNLYEVRHPGTFSLFLGRSAGFYLNPNIAGSAIIYGLILSVEVLRPGWRPWYAAFTGVGVFATLSRSSILCWVLAVGIFGLAGVIRPSWRMLALVLGCGAAVWVALPRGGVGAAVNLIMAVDGSNQISRLGVQGSQEVLGSASVEARARVAAKAWDLFAEHPLVGNGPGATLEWSMDQSTHNMYLKFLAEEGILGLFIYPLALGAALWCIPRGERPLALAFGAMWLVFGLFSHNEFEYRHTLVALALVAAITVVARGPAAPAVAAHPPR